MDLYMTNTSGFTMRQCKSFGDLTEYQRNNFPKDSTTLPKNAKNALKFRSAFDLTAQSFDFKGTLKRKVTAFSTLLRSRHRIAKQKTAFSSNDTLNFGSDSENNQETFYGNTLEELINKLVPTHSYIPEKKLTYTLLLCCRLYLLPVKLLEKLTLMIQTQLEEDKENEKLISKHFILLLTDWSNYFPLDFKDKLFMKQFNKTCKLCLTANLDVSTSINQISNKLVVLFQNLLEYIDKSKQFIIEIDDDIEDNLSNIFKNTMVFAKQLTIIEKNKISKIYSEQLLEKFIAEDITCSRLNLTNNNNISAVEIYVSWFNRLSQLVPTLICQCQYRKDRVKLINFFVEVARLCLKIGNYNSAMAIVTGLNMNSVLRMRKTWCHSNQNGFKKIENEFSPKFNFYKYRDNLIKKTQKKKEKHVIIPVFSLFVKDLYFINEGLKITRETGNVDFKKLLQMSKKVKQFDKYRKQAITFERNAEIIDFIENTPVCSEDILYKKSFDVEPPVSDFERDRYKSVRVRVERC